MTKNGVFKLFSLTVFIILLVPDLTQHGMFMDGTQYAIVAKNLAFGKGTFWHPYICSSWSKMNVNAFMEHLPLTYYLQSEFFLVFGDSVFTEKLYCLCAATACAFLIYRIWILLFNQDAVLIKYAWLAILLWFITPSVFWSFRNNMLENTVSIMVLAAVYFSLKAIYICKNALPYIIIAGIFVFLASLCKGLPGLFPIAVVFCFYVAVKKISLKTTVIYTATLICVPLIIYAAILLFNDEARESIWFYVENRLLNRIHSEHTVTNRFTVLFWLGSDLLVNAALTALLIVIFKFKLFSRHIAKKERKEILFMCLLGLCGVLPLCLTHVQRATYFVPALPFFAIAFAVFLAKGLDSLIARIGERNFTFLKIAAGVFLSGTICFCVLNSGKIARDEQILNETYTIGAITGNGKTISTSLEIYSGWNFQFYLLRYYDITLDPFMEHPNDYKLLDKSLMGNNEAGYINTQAPLGNYILLKKGN